MRLQIHPFSEWRFWVASLFWIGMALAAAAGSSGLLWLTLALPIIPILWRFVALRNAAPQWNANPGRVVWYVTVGFALMHISNYSIPVDDWRLVVAVLLVVPQLIGGLLMAYTRVRIGWWGSVVHHGISNGFLGLMILPSL